MLEITIDWLQFTSKDPNYLTTLINILRLDRNQFIELPKGKLGYKKQIALGDIYILYDGNEGMGTHVILSGKGCRQYEEKEPLIELIKRLNENEIKCTRIDLAIDDIEGKTIQIANITEDLRKGNVISKWKTSTELIKRELNTGEIIGQTINIGSRQSETFLRIYNKSLEKGIEGNWSRMELEVKGRKAEKLQSIMTVENVGQLIKKIINNYIRIVEPGNDTNKSRWKTKEYWSNIIETTEKVKLSSKKEDKTVDELKKWVESQIAPTLATISIADGGSVDFLYEQIREGQKRLKAKHRRIISRGDKNVE